MAYEPSIFYKGNVQTKRKLTSGSLEYYFFSIYPPVEIPRYSTASIAETVGLDDFGKEGTTPALVFFEPTHEELFSRNHYDVLENNDRASRRSTNYLIVDRDYSQLNPSNFEVISSSLEPNYRYLLNDEVFAEIQDSNYESRGWTISRYEGAKNTSRTDGIDPYLYLVNFTGYVFNSNITRANILASYSNLTSTQVYFYTPVQVTSNRLIPPSDYNVVSLNRTFMYTLQNNRNIATVNSSKILDTRIGIIYTTNVNGLVTASESLST